MGWTFGRGLVIGIVILAGLVVVNASVAYRNTRQLHDDAFWVAHTHEVLDALADLSAQVGLAEAEQRSYVITGDDKRLASFHGAASKAAEKAARVRKLTEDNPSQETRISEVEAQIRKTTGLLATTATTRKEQGFDAARELVAGGQSNRELGVLA